MTIEQTEEVDFITFNHASGDVWLTISDHLPWAERGHLPSLQKKLNAYLRFIESGELLVKFPEADGRRVVINLVYKFQPNEEAERYLLRATEAISAAGFDLRRELHRPN